VQARLETKMNITLEHGIECDVGEKAHDTLSRFTTGTK
jgi:hypothetical protein